MTQQKQPSGNSDNLAAIFALQAELNDYVFRKNGIRDNEGVPLTMNTISTAAAKGKVSVNDLPNQWLSRYAKAMEEELAELKDEILWKWWSRDEIDLQNIRVELVDVLHFLISAMLSAGLTPEKLYDIYRQKHQINIARQDSDYRASTKTEQDNRSIE